MKVLLSIEVDKDCVIPTISLQSRQSPELVWQEHNLGEISRVPDVLREVYNFARSIETDVRSQAERTADVPF